MAKAILCRKKYSFHTDVAREAFARSCADSSQYDFVTFRYEVFVKEPYIIEYFDIVYGETYGENSKNYSSSCMSNYEIPDTTNDISLGAMMLFGHDD